jgi:hypothetical protein
MTTEQRAATGMSRVLYRTALQADALAIYRPGGGTPIAACDHPADGAAGYTLRLPNGVVVWTDGTGRVRQIETGHER